MRRNILKELQDELRDIKENGASVIVDEDRRSAKVRRGYRTVELPESLVVRLEKIAKNRNSDIGEVIKTLAKGQK